MITHACVPDEFVEQILNANDTGQNMYEDYVTVGTNGNISLWAKVTKVGYKMFMSGNKTTPIKLRDKTVYLKETQDLYVRLMILAESETLIKKVPLEIMNLPLHRDHCFPLMGRFTDNAKLIRLLELLGNEAELEQGRLPSG